MIFLTVLAAVASMVQAYIAAESGEWGFALGLLGGFGAWVTVASYEFERKVGRKE